uniref:Eight transmembrane protein EpsH n=1 Tax=Rhodopseudomonas palustris (strain BisA53) TaxID=316055 RepID=Q07SN6_RHOP5
MTSLVLSAHPFRRSLALVLILLSVLTAIFAFHDTLAEAVRRWSTQDEYSHGFLIPVVSGWLFWTRREALRASLGQQSWLGVLVILLAGAMHVFGSLSALFIVSQMGFVVALMGIALAFGGQAFLRTAFVPIFFLFFAIPLPYFIDATLSWRLQLISSDLGALFIRTMQIPVYLEGNVIDLGSYKLQVVEACSGLRYLYPLMSLGFLAAYLFQAPIWQRLIVFLSTIPITILMNSLRIGIVGIIVNFSGPQDADGFLHMFEGWIIFVGCALLLLGEMYLLTALASRKQLFDILRPPSPTPADVSRTQWRPLLLPIISCLVLTIVTGVMGSYISARKEISPIRESLLGFPNSLGRWLGRTSSIDSQTERGLGLTDYILSDYRAPDGRSVNFYVAYYASQRNGQSPHSPSVCIPGNGWQITQFNRIEYTSESRRLTMPLNRAVIQNGSSKEIVYYWFEQRGRKVANEWVSKYYLFRDAILRNRTDGALVRLITPVYPGEEERDADRRLRAFTDEVVPNLSGFLPTEDGEPVRRAPVSLIGRNS